MGEIYVLSLQILVLNINEFDIQIAHPSIKQRSWDNHELFYSYI